MVRTNETPPLTKRCVTCTHMRDKHTALMHVDRKGGQTLACTVCRCTMYAETTVVRADVVQMEKEG